MSRMDGVRGEGAEKRWGKEQKGQERDGEKSRRGRKEMGKRAEGAGKTVEREGMAA